MSFLGPRIHRARTALTRTLAVGVVSGLVSGLGVALATPAHADHPAGGERRVIEYTVRSGDTATELAVRFHAWTAELIALNHLGSDGTLVEGSRIKIPVVVERDRSGSDKNRDKTGDKGRNKGRDKNTSKGRDKDGNKDRGSTRTGDPSRDRIRAQIIRTSHRYGVDPELALAISWQESGWAMHHVSHAGAIGAMQVMPDTGEWMSLYVGRDLNLRRTKDNIAAGVMLIRILRFMTSGRPNQIAAYYQGVGAIRDHGWFDDTRQYVANVQAIKRSLERGRPPM